MTKHATSFRLSTSTLTLLKQLADKENRSLTNMVEVLIQNKGKDDNSLRLRLANEIQRQRETHRTPDTDWDKGFSQCLDFIERFIN